MDPETATPEELAEQVEENRKSINKMQSSFITKTSAYILAGFGLVAALAWNDAIQTLFRLVFGVNSQGGLIAKFIYALIVTAILAGMSGILDRKKEN